MFEHKRKSEWVNKASYDDALTQLGKLKLGHSGKFVIGIGIPMHRNLHHHCSPISLSSFFSEFNDDHIFLQNWDHFVTFNSTIKFTRSHFMSVLSSFVTNEEECALDFRLPCFPLENQPRIYFHRVHLLAGLPSWEPLCGRRSAVVCWPCTAPASSLQPVGPPAHPPTSSSPWPACNHHLLCSPGPELHFYRFSLWA